MSQDNDGNDRQANPAKEPIYRVQFLNQGQVYEVYASGIYSSELYGFVEIEDYQFGNRTAVVIDPGEEKLRNEFEGVKRSFVPMHAVIRIDEVDKKGVAKVSASDGSNVHAFPMGLPGGAVPKGPTPGS